MEEQKEEEEKSEPKDTLKIKYPWGFSVVVKQSSGRHRTYKGSEDLVVEIDKK